ncbi:hypothetical protein F5B20DRAFT_425106 [Whalleya microplaca]|nr:hypothetical protein F5B20DRAFT_425106 [Whalleya microplaca]
MNVTVPDLSNQQSTVVQLQPLIHAAAIEVRWQRNDFATTTESSSSALTSSTSSSSAPSSIPFSPAETIISDTSPAGLSTGASVGIGVGAGLAGLLLASGLGFWIVRRRRAHASRKKSEGVDTNKEEESPHEIVIPRSPQEMRVPHYQHELVTSSNTHEFPEDFRPAELG